MGICHQVPSSILLRQAMAVADQPLDPHLLEDETLLEQETPQSNRSYTEVIAYREKLVLRRTRALKQLQTKLLEDSRLALETAGKFLSDRPSQRSVYQTNIPEYGKLVLVTLGTLSPAKLLHQ